jgi:hypothetical protein
VEILFFALILLGVLFVLPIAGWVSARRTRRTVEILRQVVESQGLELTLLQARLSELGRKAAEADVPAQAPAEQPGTVPGAPPVRLEPEQPPVPLVSTPEPVAPRPATPTPRVEPPVVPEPLEAAPPSVPEPLAVPQPPEPPSLPQPAAPGFDWEGLVGVKLFSAIAGIALVLAAVLFLRYSIENGWLQPQVRVAIGVIVAIALLVVCELKAARRYPVTANAMDAAAIAILFSTFFAAHALWNLIPAIVTFGLLAVVTVIAVLLSIRRESLFIAVLGLLGGFATPALLSTGENRPIPLFAYLLLLNVGLAWVAYNKRWPALTWLTMILTTIYQWGWVFQFLDQNSLPLAMGIFLVFPVAAIASLVLGGQLNAGDRGASHAHFEQSALISSALPLLFAIFLASVPAFGAQAALLFGFLALVDVGLLAIAIARRQELLHLAGAVTTMIVMAIWVTTSYRTFGSTTVVLGFTSLFVVIYLAAPLIANSVRRPFEAAGVHAQFAASLLLFVFPMLAGIGPTFVQPWPLVLTLIALLALVAWRAISANAGALYYTAAFFAVATQAVWSAEHLTIERLDTAVAVYALFGAFTLGVPVVARRVARPLQPLWGSGAVLLISLALLFFLSTGPVAPASLWALALLLAIMNAGLFVESAAGRLPVISQIGSAISWIILVTWWGRAAGSVGVLASLTVVTGLALVTLLGHGWSVRKAAATGDSEPATFTRGLYLGLTGHLFLLVLATNRYWSLPPWPLFGSLTVITLATTVASLWIKTPVLHAAGAMAASLVVAVWSANAGSPTWGLTAVLAAAAVSAYALGWIPAARRLNGEAETTATAGAVLFAGELSLILAVGGGTTPSLPVLVVAHAANMCALLALTLRCQWRHVAVAAVAPAWLAVLQWQTRINLAEAWPELLTFSGVLYAIFVAYPVAAARRNPGDRDPYLAAVLASAMGLFAARAAFLAGQLDWMIGLIPVVEGAVLALLLRQLLRIEAAGERDLGRLALVAGASLAFITVAIPMQLSHQWITIGWALEGAALAWVYGRIPHRGLLYAAVALLGTVFVRLTMNPEVLTYEPRGAVRIFNWYLYTYVLSAVALFLGARWLAKTDERIAGHRPSSFLPAAGVIVLFFLLNIEIADFYATGPTIMFRFGATVSQDLTYTIGWLVFGMVLLAAGIYVQNRPARVAAVALIAVTTFKCFLYDLSSLEGLHRIASFVGLAISLALVSLALQKYVLSRPRTPA